MNSPCHKSGILLRHLCVSFSSDLVRQPLAKDILSTIRNKIFQVFLKKVLRIKGCGYVQSILWIQLSTNAQVIHRLPPCITPNSTLSCVEAESKHHILCFVWLLWAKVMSVSARAMFGDGTRALTIPESNANTGGMRIRDNSCWGVNALA